MRRTLLSLTAAAVGMITTGCIMVIGTGTRVHEVPEGAHVVEIEGKLYVVDVDKGTVHAMREDDDGGSDTANH